MHKFSCLLRSPCPATSTQRQPTSTQPPAYALFLRMTLPTSPTLLTLPVVRCGAFVQSCYVCLLWCSLCLLLWECLRQHYIMDCSASRYYALVPFPRTQSSSVTPHLLLPFSPAALVSCTFGIIFIIPSRGRLDSHPPNPMWTERIPH